MPNIDAVVAESVKQEVAFVSQSHSPDDIRFKYEMGTASITIHSTDITKLALSTAKIMARRLQIFGIQSDVTPIQYASAQDIESVLNSLKTHAEQTSSPHVVTAINTLLSTAKEIKSM